MIAAILFINLVSHLLFASILPLSNDEAYYWEWGQWLQLSYFDHPPGISWLTAAAAHLGSGLLQIRLLSPFLHTLTLYLSLKILEQCLDKHDAELRKKQLLLSLLSFASPGLFFIGSLAMPDVGLLLFMQLALYLSLRLIKSQSLQSYWGLVWGGCLGLAALFKYHAFPLGLGLGIGLLLVRWRQGKFEWTFFLSALLTAVLVLSPVWIWNIQHDWASLRFQSAHGFSQGHLNLRWPLQGLLACALLLGPSFLYLGLRSCVPRKSLWSDDASLLILPAFWSLVLLIAFAGLRKAILPHWILPAFSLALPLIVSRLPLAKIRGALIWHWIYGTVFITLIGVMSYKPLFNDLVLSALKGDPGALSELSIWDPMASQIQTQLETWEQNWQFSEPELCEQHIPLASLRWYAAAQLHFRLQSRPPVMTLQEGTGAFYSERDRDRKHPPCALAIIMNGSQRQQGSGLSGVEIIEEKRLTIPFHERQTWFLMLARWRHTPG